MQMQQVARGYLAYKLSGNALSLGLVTLSMGLPRIVLSPIGGVMADRFSKRSVLMGTQAVLGVSTAVAGVMVALNVMTVPWLMVFGFVQGAAFSFNLPARQAYLPQLTGKGAMLSNAIALNSAGMNLTRVVGPALAGLLIAVPRIDVAGVYALTAVCFLCVWVTTYQVQNRGVSAMSRRSMGQSLSDGFRYIGARPHLLVLMSLGFVPLAIGMVYINLMPVVALGKLNIGSQGLGLLLTVSACGSLVGTLVIAYIAAFPRKAALQLALGVTFGLAGFCLQSESSMAGTRIPVSVSHRHGGRFLHGAQQHAHPLQHRRGHLWSRHGRIYDVPVDPPDYCAANECAGRCHWGVVYAELVRWICGGFCRRRRHALSGLPPHWHGSGITAQGGANRAGLKCCLPRPAVSLFSRAIVLGRRVVDNISALPIPSRVSGRERKPGPCHDRQGGRTAPTELPVHPCPPRPPRRLAGAV